MRAFFFSRTGLLLVGLLALAGYFLWIEHEAHILAYLPFLFLILCPVMHLFMHRGHHKHDDAGGGHKDGSVPRSGDGDV